MPGHTTLLNLDAGLLLQWKRQGSHPNLLLPPLSWSTTCLFGGGLVTPLFPSWWNNFSFTFFHRFLRSLNWSRLPLFRQHSVCQLMAQAERMWHNVLYFSQWHCDKQWRVSSVGFQRTRLAGDDNISYADFTRRLICAMQLPMPQLSQGHLTLHSSLTVLQVKIPQPAFTLQRAVFSQ